MARRELIGDKAPPPGDAAPQQKKKKRRSKKTVPAPADAVAPAGVGRVNIETVAVSDINPAPYNPRKTLEPGDPEWARLKSSIEAFGTVDPLVWNRTSGNLVGGHQRLRVLVHEWNVEKVDVSVVELSPERERTLNVALNKIAGEWDFEKLGELLGELRLSDDVDETLTGFDKAHIDKMLDEARQEEDTSPQLADGISFAVTVRCTTEGAQKELVARLESEGYSCQLCML